MARSRSSHPFRAARLTEITAPSKPLSAAETCLLALCAADLLLLPWWFGGMSVAGQVTALLLGIAAFGCAIWSRLSSADYANDPVRVVRRLVRFPVFWLGAVWLTLIVVQSLNPAWEFRSGPAGWNLRRLDPIAWLPHGVGAAPFAMVNAWRVLMIHAGAWLLVCALWLGITRRRSARLLLTLIAVNGALFAGVALLQRLTGATRMLWLWDPPAAYFVAGIIYKNHAGAFLNLAMAACLALAWWHAAHAREQGRKSHPGLLFGFLAVLIFAAQLLTFSRAATLLGAVMLFIVGLAIVVEGVFRARQRTPLPVLAALAVLGLGFAGVCAVSLDLENVWQRFGRLLESDRMISVTHRQLAARATLDMAEASPVLGHGAGSYRFVFPVYQQRYPEIFARPDQSGKPGTGLRMYWEHAHNDYAETWAERGLLGLGLAGATLACAAVAFWRARAFRQPVLLIALLGPTAVALHAAVDFPFQNPAVLLTTVAIVVLGVRWGQFERSLRVPGDLR